MHACKRASVKARERASVRVGPCVRVGRCSVRLWKKRGSGFYPLGGPLQENTARSSSHSCCSKRKTSCGACRRCHRPICEQPAEVHARNTRAYSRTHACTHARMHARILHPKTFGACFSSMVFPAESAVAACRKTCLRTETATTSHAGLMQRTRLAPWAPVRTRGRAAVEG